MKTMATEATQKNHSECMLVAQAAAAPENFGNMHAAACRAKLGIFVEHAVPRLQRPTS
jgi:hypothetical protein